MTFQAYQSIPILKYRDQDPKSPIVKLIYHSNYYDGPLSGVCTVDDKRYWFELCEELEARCPTECHCQCDEHEHVAMMRRFAVLELTPEEWAIEDARHKAFQEAVGTHTDYTEAGTRSLEGVKPSQTHDEYYRRQQAGEWPEPAVENKKIVYFLDGI